MTDGQIILTGWKDICQACGIKSIKTMKKRVKKYKIPIMRMNGRPCISKENLIKWYSEFVSDSDKDMVQKGFIYFIQYGEDGPIKIGFSTNVNERINFLQNTSPVELKLLCSVEGTISDEQKLQKRFKKYRIRNEYFFKDRKLMEFINNLQKSA